MISATLEVLGPGKLRRSDKWEPTCPVVGRLSATQIEQTLAAELDALIQTHIYTLTRMRICCRAPGTGYP